MSKRPLLVAALAATTGLLAAAPAAVADGSGADALETSGSMEWIMRTDDTGTFGLSVPASWGVDGAPQRYMWWDQVPALVATAPDDSAELRVFAAPLTDHDELYTDGGTFVGTDVDRPFTESEFTSSGGNLHGTRTDWPIFEDYWGESSVLVDYQSHYSIYITLGSRDQATLDRFDAIVGSFSPILTELPPSVASAATPAPGQVPTVDGPVDSFWADFRSVPQLGAEPVRGSGCGSNADIGDVVPDGTWAAFVTWDEGEADAYNVDLLCVYTPQAAPDIIAAGGATIINNDPNYLVVNNSTRTRYVPTTMFVGQFQYVDDGNGTCVIDPHNSGPGDPERQAWIEIENGIAVAVGWDCQALGGAPTAQTPAPTNPPSAPAGNDVWPGFPFSQFWDVPQLGSAPVRGSGCGSGTDGDVLGDSIPDGWWAGYVSTDYATGTLWVDVVCIYYGESAQAILAAGTATVVNDEPDYLIVNNSNQRRAVPNGLAEYTIAVGSLDNGRCEAWPLGYVQQGDGLPTQPMTAATDANQAWIYIDGGRATALAYGCDVQLP